MDGMPAGPGEALRVFRVRVFGDPKAQPRPRAFARKMGDAWQARVFNPGTAEGWKSALAVAIRGAMAGMRLPLPGVVRVDAAFLFARPQRLMRRKDPQGRIPHGKKPDRDNLDKALLDALVQMGALVDDGQVSGGMVEKWFVALGEAPGAEIVITVIDEATL
jgi:Holliday junction resolvase RusA-like endonuclease